MQRDDWRQAEQLLAEAIRQDPTSTQARRYYAETLWHRKAFDRAVVEMETAMRLDRCDPHAAVRAGQMRLTLGHVDKARLHADQAVQRDPQLAAAWQLRGQVVSAAGDTERALADFHRALDLESDNRAVLWHVAELYRLRNQPHRALSTLQHLADTYVPGEEPSQVFYWQGLACAALGRHDDAVDCLQTASRRGESTADVWYQLAEVQLRGRRRPPTRPTSGPGTRRATRTEPHPARPTQRRRHGGRRGATPITAQPATVAPAGDAPRLIRADQDLRCQSSSAAC